jgi:pre-mRNA-processing factor SLU7
LLLPTAEDAGNAKEIEKEAAWKEEAREEKHVPNAEDKPEKMNMDESRRRMEELKAGVTEEQMEEYRKGKVNQNDPMAKLLGKDELLDG